MASPQGAEYWLHEAAKAAPVVYLPADCLQEPMPPHSTDLTAAWGEHAHIRMKQPVGT